MATGLGGMLKSMLYEDENPPTAPAPTAQTVAQQPVVATPVSTPVRTFVDTAQADPDIQAQLQEVIAGANQVSATEFTNFLSAMAAALSGTDERTLYRAALAAAGKKGFGPEEIARGFDAMTGALDVEERHFNEMANQQIRERVGSRQGEIEQLEQKVRANTERMAQLQADIQDCNTRKNILASEIRAEEQKVEDKKRKFSMTLTVEKGRITEERRKVLAYGGKGA